MRLWNHPMLADLLLGIDEELAEDVRQGSCPHCGGRLDRADFSRKPRGMTDWDQRISFCCSKEGCRKRRTPPSVRFLGRRVYAGVVVVLVSAMSHGLSAARVQRLRESLGIDPRTLKRWRAWWSKSFVHTECWKGSRSRFLPPLDPSQMPLGLVERFEALELDGLLRLMRFLRPITTGSLTKSQAM